MGLVIFNASLYISALLVYWYKRRKVDVGFVLLAVYATIAVFNVFYYASDTKAWKLQLWSFIYLFVIVLLFFRPLLFDSDTLYKRLQVKNMVILNVFAIIYVIAAIISIYYSFVLAVENIKSGEWALLRNQLYEGDFALYTSQLQRFANIFIGYLAPLAVVLLFYFLTLEKVKKIWLLILSLAIIIPSFLGSINTASRGMILNLAVLMILGYIIFRSKISKNARKGVLILSGLFILIFLIYSIAVTNSRFGDENRTQSLLSYFGHSMLVFNYGLTDSIQIFGNGKYFFNWFLPIFSILPLDIGRLGAHFGTSFYTFVGAWYIDFGPIGTFLISIFLPMTIGRRLKYKKRIDIADIFLILFYANYLFMGVFVVGLGNSLKWLITFFIYGILKIIR